MEFLADILIGAAHAQGTAAQAASDPALTGKLSSGFDAAWTSVQGMMNTGRKQLAWLLSLVVLVVFARDRFAQPSYTKDDEGYLARFAPRFLASSARYREGQLVYTSVLIGLFLVLTLSGPNIIALLGGSATPAGVKQADVASEVYPLVVALFLVGIGVANDMSPLGRIEFLLRRYAHQRAFIPNGSRSIARRLQSERHNNWLVPKSLFAKRLLKDYLHTALLLDASFLINKPDPGGDATRNANRLGTLREFTEELAKIMDAPDDDHSDVKDFSSRPPAVDTLFEKVQKDEFATSYYIASRLRLALVVAEERELFSPAFQEQNGELLQSLKTQFENISREVRTALSDTLGAISEVGAEAPAEWFDVRVDRQIGELGKLQDETASVLACGLLSGGRSDFSVSETLRRIGFGESGVPIRRSWTGYAATVLLIPPVVVLFGYLLFQALGGTIASVANVPGAYMEAQGRELLFGAFNGGVGYVVLFLVLSAMREARLNAGTWRSSSYHRMRLIGAATLMASIVALWVNIWAFNTRSVVNGASLFALWLQPAVLLLIAAVVALWHWSKAGRDPLRVESTAAEPKEFRVSPRHTRSLVLRGLPSAVLHGLIAATVVFLVTSHIKQKNFAEQFVGYTAALAEALETSSQCFEEDEKKATCTKMDNASSYHKWLKTNRESLIELARQLRASERELAGAALFDLEWQIVNASYTPWRLVRSVHSFCAAMLQSSEAEASSALSVALGREPQLHSLELFDMAWRRDEPVCVVSRFVGLKLPEYSDKSEIATSQTTQKMTPDNSFAILAEQTQRLVYLIRKVAVNASKGARGLACDDRKLPHCPLEDSKPIEVDRAAEKHYETELHRNFIASWFDNGRRPFLASEARREAFVAAGVGGWLAFLLALAFSLSVYVGRCQELDEFFADYPPSGFHNIDARIAKVYPPDAAGPDGAAQLAYQLAHERGELGHCSVQEALLHDGMSERWDALAAVVRVEKDLARQATSPPATGTTTA